MNSQARDAEILTQAALLAPLFCTLQVSPVYEDAVPNLLRDQALQWVPEAVLQGLESSFWSFLSGSRVAGEEQCREETILQISQ